MIGNALYPTPDPVFYLPNCFWFVFQGDWFETDAREPPQPPSLPQRASAPFVLPGRVSWKGARSPRARGGSGRNIPQVVIWIHNTFSSNKHIKVPLGRVSHRVAMSVVCGLYICPLPVIFIARHLIVHKIT